MQSGMYLYKLYDDDEESNEQLVGFELESTKNIFTFKYKFVY